MFTEGPGYTSADRRVLKDVHPAAATTSAKPTPVGRARLDGILPFFAKWETALDSTDNEERVKARGIGSPGRPQRARHEQVAHRAVRNQRKPQSGAMSQFARQFRL